MSSSLAQRFLNLARRKTLEVLRERNSRQAIYCLPTVCNIKVYIYVPMVLWFTAVFLIKHLQKLQLLFVVLCFNISAWNNLHINWTFPIKFFTDETVDLWLIQRDNRRVIQLRLCHLLRSPLELMSIIYSYPVIVESRAFS